METIEARIPNADWAKLVTSVSPRAKTGHDWQGSWLDTGKLVDLAPGTLIVTCSTVGSRKHPRKKAIVRALLPDGGWTTICSVEDNEWAYELRDEAIAFLATEDHLKAAIANTIAKRKTALVELEKTLAEFQAKKAEAEEKIASWQTQPITERAPGECRETVCYGTMHLMQDETLEARLPEARANAEARLADAVKAVDSKRAQIAKYEALLTPAASDPSPSATEATDSRFSGFTDAELIAQIEARGYRVLPPARRTRVGAYE